ncbi:Alpha/Beta hydrolase protein [Apodospora peruviana]|uniref:Alpha/Beta hydrolase protein n=1 Tax=Apodospora peruviana TaxID=516989 RepID=A0AAE0HSB3_9PEZI|nr:Alpha/Beta hydrolase protein [Apodospora peruviana]
MADFSRFNTGPSAEWRAVEAALPPFPTFSSIQERKDFLNAGRETAAKADMAANDFESKIQMKDYSIPTRDGSSIEARTYRPLSCSSDSKLPVYIHLHGGGFVFGTLSSEDATCSRIAITSQVIVLNVNYRHTPEHTYPTALHDTEDAFAWLHDHIDEVGGIADQIVVGGISAGAWLTAWLVLGQHLQVIEKGLPKIAGQVLQIPCLVHHECYAPQRNKLKDPETSSYVVNKDAPILPVAMVKLFTDLLKVRSDLNENDLRLNPGNAKPEQVRGLPPSVFGIAGMDPLRDEGLLYGKMLSEQGVATDIHLFEGLPHGFRRFGADKLPECTRWDRVVAEGITWALSKPEASGKFEVKTD